MPVFFRINENGLSWVGNVQNLGFPNYDPSYIPDDYLKNQEFVLFRTANGFGDWGILSAMPRLLKEKYPNCKIYLPSEKLLKKFFTEEVKDWDHWPNPEKNVERVYKNNPYIDGYIDKLDNDVFHDHYRIYNEEDVNEPLINQVLKFWQFSEDELEDNQPEIYWTEDEKKEGDEIIKQYFGDKEFCGLILSNTDIGDGQYEGDSEDKLQMLLKEYSEYGFIYYGDKTPYDFVKVGLNLKDLDISIRVQLYIRSKAKINLGYASSMYDVLPRYVDVTCISVRTGMKSNTIKGMKYL